MKKVTVVCDICGKEYPLIDGWTSGTVSIHGPRGLYDGDLHSRVAGDVCADCAKVMGAAFDELCEKRGTGKGGA